MQFVGKLVTSVSDFYRDLNPSTLTGAMDVIVIEEQTQDNKLERRCSPFHVRIGKLQLMRPQDKRVEMSINSVCQEQVEMKVGEAGEAFFVVPEEDYPVSLMSGEESDLATSPLPPAPLEPQSHVADLSLSPKKPTKVAPTKNTLTGAPSVLSDTEVDYAPMHEWVDVLEHLRDIARVKRQLAEISVLTQGKPFKYHSTFYLLTFPVRVYPASDYPMVIDLLNKTEIQLKDFLSNPDCVLNELTRVLVRVGDTWWFTGRIGLMVGLSAAVYGHVPCSTEELELLFNQTHVTQPIAITPSVPIVDEPRTSSWRNWWSRPSSIEIPNPGAGSSGTSAGSPAVQASAQQQAPPLESEKMSKKRFLKSLRLTSEQLKTLPLNPGSNLVTFTFATGRSCQSRIFLWPSSAKIVISDIDGTITKSDALGHILTFVGRDWTHLGVAGLYDRIYRNGYHIMYLTARAIGQAGSTREYLRGVEQDKCQLPEGPVIMSPDRLLTALRREVIIGNPEEFKIACLKDIQSLFPSGDNPFFAGFGNRFTDAQSYHTVGIPPHRIFTVEPGGEVRVEHGLGYASTYSRLLDLADLLFPCVAAGLGTAGAGPRNTPQHPLFQGKEPEFNDYSFWKKPVLPVDTIEDLAALLPPPASTAVVAGEDVILIEPSGETQVSGISESGEENEEEEGEGGVDAFI